MGVLAQDRPTTLIESIPAADPAPLGLAAFALTTFLLSGHNASFIPDAVWIGPALFYGGLAQFAAGMWEFKNGNTFGATAFTSYGAFWLSYAAFVFLFAPKLAAADAAGAVGTFLLGWGIFTAYMWLATLRHAWPTMVVFLLLAITFFVLAWSEYASSSTIKHIGGYIGILTAIAAWYASAASIIDEAFGRKILPR